MCGVGGDAGEHVRQPGLSVYVVKIGGDDQVVHGRSPLAAAIRPAEEPRLSAERYAPERPFGGVVREADAPVIKESGERRPALEHVIHGLGPVVAAGELGALFTHVGLQVRHQRRAEGLADGASLIGGLAVTPPQLAPISDHPSTGDAAQACSSRSSGPCSRANTAAKNVSSCAASRPRLRPAGRPTPEGYRWFCWRGRSTGASWKRSSARSTPTAPGGRRCRPG